MSIGEIGMLAPGTTRPAGFHVSTMIIVIVVVVAVLAIFAIFGWRAPDRSPGADTKAERDRIDD
jgi:heme/copper-type cytochrome/quinol oxidase subunit 2